MKRVLLTLLTLSLALPLRAGVLASGDGFADLEGGEPFAHRLACQGDRARWDFTGRNYIEGSILYRGDRDVFWVVDPVKKAYFELPAVSPSEGDMRIGLLAVMYAVARRALSREQTAELDRALGRMPMPETLLDFKANGSARAGRVKGDRFEAFFNGAKRGEVLAAGEKALGLPKEDYEALDGFLRTLNRLYDNFGFLFPDPAPGTRNPYRGVPLKWTFPAAGRPTFALEFKTIERRELDASLFELPAGLKKVEVFDLLLNK
jgi:hypothetical protein